jgi:hypothetical protein
MHSDAHATHHTPRTRAADAGAGRQWLAVYGAALGLTYAVVYLVR